MLLVLRLLQVHWRQWKIEKTSWSLFAQTALSLAIFIDNHGVLWPQWSETQTCIYCNCGMKKRHGFSRFKSTIYFIVMHHQAQVKFWNFYQMKFWDILLTETYAETCRLSPPNRDVRYPNSPQFEHGAQFLSSSGDKKNMSDVLVFRIGTMAQLRRFVGHWKPHFIPIQRAGNRICIAGVLWIQVRNATARLFMMLQELSWPFYLTGWLEAVTDRAYVTDSGVRILNKPHRYITPCYGTSWLSRLGLWSGILRKSFWAIRCRVSLPWFAYAGLTHYRQIFNAWEVRVGIF